MVVATHLLGVGLVGGVQQGGRGVVEPQQAEEILPLDGDQRGGGGNPPSSGAQPQPHPAFIVWCGG